MNWNTVSSFKRDNKEISTKTIITLLVIIVFAISIMSISVSICTGYLDFKKAFSDYIHSSENQPYFIVNNRGLSKVQLDIFLMVNDESFNDRIERQEGMLNGFVEYLEQVRQDKRTLSLQIVDQYHRESNTQRLGLDDLYGVMYINNMYSKEETLNLYMNFKVFTINNLTKIRGLGTTSREYFDKSPNDLTIAEMSIIAALSIDSENFNPINKQKNQEGQLLWKVKCAEILQEAFEKKIITDDDFDKAIKEIDALSFSTTYVSKLNTDF